MEPLQGILFSTADVVKTPMDIIRLWLHEASRVYGDKFIDEKDMETFKKMKFDIAEAGFEVYNRITQNYSRRPPSIYAI